MKENKKIGILIIGLILGLIIAGGGVYAVSEITGSSITYSNTKSGLTSTNVQGAIDELYNKADIRKADRFVMAYTYSESGVNKCITGKEETCKRTTCYKTKTANSCPSGTIIFYKVNDLTILPFHVMFDDGSIMTLISQEKIVNNTEWSQESDDAQGANTILTFLENTTSNWTNVNDQTYTLGTTNLSGKGIYTGCDSYNSCATNTYTLPERTAKARMITVQEAASLGCTGDSNSCPKYLISSSSYWTLNSHNDSLNVAYIIDESGKLYLGSGSYTNNKFGTRAVTIITK